MKIPQNKIDEIASSLDIVDVISQYTRLRKAGKNFMGRCPFHEERTPSFSVSQEKGVYHCFGCGKSGNIFTFVMDIDKVSFFDSVKILADKANIQIEFENEQYDGDKNQIETIYEINKKAAKYFYDNLMGRDGEYAREYLRQRGIKDDTITKFGLGYALRERDALYKKFINEYSREDIAASGLILNIASAETVDRFRGRLMFPIINESSRVIGFGARKLYEEDYNEAKYINSPETKIYNKSKVLYGLNLAKNSIKKEGFVILVEGYMDLISLFQNGFENVGASSGTSLTPLQIKILSRYTNEIVIVYDSDLAGQNASRRAIEIIIESGNNVSLVVLPRGDDPDSYIKNNGREKFIEAVQKRQSVINYIGEKYKEEGRLVTPDGKAEFVREIIGLISKIRDEIKRDFYIKDIAEKFSIYESSIRRELEKQIKSSKKSYSSEEFKPGENIKPKSPEQDIPHNELLLIRYLVDSDIETKKYLSENLEIEYITNPDVRKIVNFIVMNINNKEKISLVNLFNEFSDETMKNLLGKALLDENYVMQEKKNKNYLPEAKFIINHFRKLAIERKIAEVEIKMKSSNKMSPEMSEDQVILQKLIAERFAIEKNMKVI